MPGSRERIGHELRSACDAVDELRWRLLSHVTDVNNEITDRGAQIEDAASRVRDALEVLENAASRFSRGDEIAAASELNLDTALTVLFGCIKHDMGWIANRADKLNSPAGIDLDLSLELEKDCRQTVRECQDLIGMIDSASN